MPDRCLLVIDMQNDFVGPTAVMRCEGGREIIPAIEALVTETRRAGVPVIWVIQEHRRQLVDFGRERDVSPVHCVEGTPGAALADPLRREPDDFLVVKRRFSSFLGTDLDLLLHGLGVKEIYLAGAATDGCVRATAVDGHQLGYRVRVIRDCVAGATVARHQAALDYLSSLQPGLLVTAAQALESFRSGDPAFRSGGPAA